MVVDLKQQDRENTAIFSDTVTFRRDGNRIVAVLGRDLQTGIGGFGNTSADALRALAARMEAGHHRIWGIDF